MNIIQRLTVWQQFKFQLPMIVCAVFVVFSQRKIILNTLKTWWSWGFSNWPQERINFMIMLMVGIMTFGLTLLVNNAWRKEIVEKQQQEVVAKMLEEKVITQEQLEKERKEAAERERERERETTTGSKKRARFYFSP